MKTLDDAVIELNGVLPAEPHPDSKLSGFEGIYYVFEDEVRAKLVNGHIVYNELIGQVSKFQQRAKELGFVGRYRWGVEYETDGKRPDLADDVLVMYCGKCARWNESPVEIWYVKGWERIKSFKITDERYKPADTSYLDKPATLKDVTDTKVTAGQMADALRQIGTGKPDSSIDNGCIEVDMVTMMQREFDGRSPAFKEMIQGTFNESILKLKAEQAKAERKRVVFEAQKLCVSLAYKDLCELYDKGFLRLPD